MIECLLRLVDRSLVVHEPDTNRYRLLETLRQFGADRLTEAGETADVRARHAAWFLAIAERVSPGLRDARYPTSRAAMVDDLDNLRSTADWCIETGSMGRPGQDGSGDARLPHAGRRGRRRSLAPRSGRRRSRPRSATRRRRARPRSPIWRP